MNKKDWIEMTADTFKIIFKNSALKRAKYSGIRKNIKALLNKN